MTTDFEPSTPPALQVLPTAKEKKYDRQLRLWGASGQAALEESHVLLVNNGTGVTGVETLKNLVLPGIGRFSIQDTAIVTEADLGVNFFLEEESLGKFRATETTRLLNELNPDVQGHAITEPIETLATRPSAFAEFSLILVAAPLDPAILLIIQEQALQKSIPLFYFHSVGFYSHFAIQLPPAFPIVDTHPDQNTTQDLRLLKPWPELERYARQCTENITALSDHDKGHIPYVCLLMHYIERWKANNPGKLPESYKDKVAIRNMVQRDGGDEENFTEAYNAVLKSLNPPTVSSAVKDILKAPETDGLGPASASFWFIAKAIHVFLEKNNVLPLPGTLPDMKAQSSEYIKLQRIYKDKARADCAEVAAIVRELEHKAGRGLQIDVHEIENFCKAAGQIHLVRGRKIPIVEAGQRVAFGDRAKSLLARLSDPDSLLTLQLSFLAWDEFNASHLSTSIESSDAGLTTTARIPGSIDTPSDLEADEEKLASIAHRILDDLISQNGTTIENPEYDGLVQNLRRICIELVRAGGAELHNIASLTGGMIAQEVVKAVTAQYSPVDNTCLFDGIDSKASVLQI